MESNNNQKITLERVVSGRAVKLGNSFPCQICVVGFLCGVCLASLFLAALTSIGGISFSSVSMSISPCNSTAQTINMVPSVSPVKENERSVGQSRRRIQIDEDRTNLLVLAWDKLILSESDGKESEHLRQFGLNRSNVPNAPHLERCESKARVDKRLDMRVGKEKFPPWTSWKGRLGMHPAALNNEQLQGYRHQASSEGAYPSWVDGADEENYPLTRKVQRDIWIHQHPVDCKDPNVKFLVADWERLPGFGIGAQIAGMCGLLGIAIKEQRVLVTNYYNRADHDGCKGASRASWSCYFFPETSKECRDRAFELLGQKEELEKGIVTVKENYTSKEIWAGKTPRVWGEPWKYMQPTTEINGSFVAFHRKMDRRWWRAQAVRYLMRFQTEYMCGLMNTARHAAFGKEAARMVLESLDDNWPKVIKERRRSDMEEFVWWNHKPWRPRPLLSMHVRMGDKACEMKVVSFKEYMRLANRIRTLFPSLNNIWLSTEMQEVIDKSEEHTKWRFYYTKVGRQAGNMTMATYEASLGRETSTNYPLVNFLMASDADYFVGALGSTWCFLIDGMRNTGGKVMSGYLSVNKDRFW